MQWVALYDSLEDDVFDGQLGLDEWDTPRILIECSVIGGKYTSVMQGIERIRQDIHDEHGAQEESGGIAAVPEQRQKVVPKKRLPPPQQVVKDRKQPVEFSATLEFIETRDDKVKGRSKFSPRLISDSNSSNRDDPIIKEQCLRIKAKAEEKEEEIKDLQDLCKKFDMDRFRDKI